MCWEKISREMTVLLIILATICGLFVLLAFGAGILSGVAGSFFNFLKGIFGVGQGCAKGCISVVMVLLVTLLFIVLAAKFQQ